METIFIALRVVVVLAVIVLVLWYVQRRVTKGRGVARRTNAVNVVGRQGVGPKASVVVVDVDGQRFVLGVTERQVNVLHTADLLPDADVTPLKLVRRTFAKDLPERQDAAATAESAETIETAHTVNAARPAQAASSAKTANTAKTTPPAKTANTAKTAKTAADGDSVSRTSPSTRTTHTDTRQDADFLTAHGRASLFDEALKGSILSPATWRQASSAVRPKK